MIYLSNFYFLQLQLPFPSQWLQGQPSGHWQALAVADLITTGTFIKPTPRIIAPNIINETLNFLIGHDSFQK